MVQFNKDEVGVYQIVIRGNETSEYYHEYTKPSWEKAGFSVYRFNAITPTDVEEYEDLNFSEFVMSRKYTAKGLKKIFTPTEKAVWYSHFLLWEKCLGINKPIVVLEHDCLLLDETKIVTHPGSEMVFYDTAAMGSYYLTPVAAKELVQKAINQRITAGPYAFIADAIRDVELQRKYGKDFIVDSNHKLYDPGTRQVMSRKFGNTIEHYKGTAVEHLANTFPQHNFLMID